MTATAAPDRIEPSVRPHSIPSLDGLRTVSIGLVLIGHLNGTRGFPLTHNVLLEMADWSNIGVRVFFVISGFLITGLLLQEIAEYGAISLPRFYFRRTLRIFPPYYVYIICVVIAAAYGLAQLRPGDVLAAATYTMNYHELRGWPLGHAWSLAVEEQFYLLWPAVLVLAGVRRGLWFAVVFVICAPIVRMALLAFAHGAASSGTSFETVGDAIAVGCLLAGLRSWLWSQPAYRGFLESKLFALVPVVIAAIATLPLLEAKQSLGIVRYYIGAYDFAGVTIMNVGIAMCVDWAIRNTGRPIGRLLNWRPVAYIGTISYSLYLWQEPFLNRARGDAWTRFPVNIGLAFAFALASFYVVERPAMRVRRSLERRWRLTSHAVA